MNIPQLKIGDLTAKLPIIQGGMGIGISRSKLAAAVASEGGIGVISGVQIGYEESDFLVNTLQANLRALRKEIQEAKDKSKNGIIGVNLMVAMKNYQEMVKEAVKEKVDVIISGAGLPIDLPHLVKDSPTKIVPIVSSGKAAKIILKMWDKLQRTPDAIIIEGPMAGGHLGFKAKDLAEKTNQTLEEIIHDVLHVVHEYETKLKKSISVIAAGGIINGKDISHFMKSGVQGVQMGSRFVATQECDATIAFKEAYLNAKEQDICLMKSPVGLPGRAIINNFLRKIETERIPVKRCFNCLNHCDPSKTPFCISDALISSVKTGEGLIFSGARVGEIKEIVSVNELMNELKRDMLVYS